MKDRETIEVAELRASQEDPIVMYLICRESLGMSIGKACAQAGHVAMMIHIEYEEKLKCWDINQSAPATYKLHLYEKWLNTSFRKVTLAASDKEWEKVKLDILPEDRVIVIDHGLTEIPSGSETFCAIWPMYKSQRPKILKKLQALK